jgi:hypothetical protein
MLIQAAQVAAVANGTTTRSSVKLKRSYSSADIIINITGGGAVTGTLQLFLQDSLDNGTTWNDLVASNTFTFGAAAVTQLFTLYGPNADGPGLIRSIAGTSPAAGAEISETVPTGVRWELMSFHAQLVTSGTVANRLPRITIDDGTNVYYRRSTTSNHAASATFFYVAAPGIPDTGTANNNIVGLSTPVGLRLTGGHRIKTITTAIDATDQWSGVRYVVREWRDLQGAAAATETFPAGLARSGPFGTLLRVREVITNIAGSPTGPTYSVIGVFK